MKYIVVDKISNYILDNLLYKDEKVEGDEREIMLFGVTRIVEDIPKYTLIILISCYLGVIKRVGIVFLITLLYKVFVGGAHARTNLGCLVVSTLYFLIPAFLPEYLNIGNKVIYILYSIVFIFSLYVIINIVPADTEEIPILNKNKRKLMKCLAFISLIGIYVLVLIINNSVLYKITLTTVFLIDLVAIKPVYKMFRCKYSYESEEFKDYF